MEITSKVMTECNASHNTLWKSQITKLSTQGLIMLAKDAEMRIGSHVAGGNPCDEYVAKQLSLLILIQEELANRP